MLGSYYRDSPGLTSQVHALEKFIPHPEYDFKSLKHDIAVAKLQVRYSQIRERNNLENIIIFHCIYCASRIYLQK